MSVPRTRKRIRNSNYLSFFFFTIAVGLCSLLLYTFYWYSSLPDVTQLKTCITTKFRSVFLCPKNKDYIALRNVPPFLVDALLISEDVNFYNHKGFDWDEIGNSLQQNLERGYYYRGASTLSQQLVKNVFFSEEKSLQRKISEAVLTFQLEKSFSKSFILEKYLNVVELGEGVFGFEKAAQFYFQKSVSELSLLEASFMVHLLPNPISYSKAFQQGTLSDWNKKRMSQILGRLYKFKRVDEDSYIQAVDQLNNLSWFLPPEDSPPEDLPQDFSEESDEVEKPTI